MLNTSIIVVGAGLSGLHTAYRLSTQRTPFILLEARSRAGGRIRSFNPGLHHYDPALPGIDLGPAWFWPGQHRIWKLLEALGLMTSVFAQHSDGDSVYEDENGIRRGAFGVSMHGSYRLSGGIGQLVAVLESRIPRTSLWTDTQVTALTLTGEGVAISVRSGGDVVEISAQAVVIALPPRLAMATIEFAPALSEERREALEQVPTWMAGQAKLVALYGEPFWRLQGLSGDSISRVGPMQEVHDATPVDGDTAALFGFIGVMPDHRKNNDDVLKQAALAQLVRLFGETAGNPKELVLKDWAFDALTATMGDRRAVAGHTNRSIGTNVEPLWHDRLVWSGAESVPVGSANNGYLEGALEASERTLEHLRGHLD